MKVYDCKCEGCKAEFQAVLEDTSDKIECPSCSSQKVEMTEAAAGCGGGCGSCSGSCK